MKEPHVGKFLSEVTARMQSGGRTGRSRDSVLTRTLEMAFLAKVMLELEAAHGKRLDAYKVLSSIIIHDLIQTEAPGVPDGLRKDVLEKIRKQEEKELDLLLKSIPPEAALRLREYYGLQYDRKTPEGRFFEAVELLGSVIFAVRDVKGNDASLLGKSQSRIRELSGEFKSLEILYQPYSRIVEGMLKP
jgi:5'-deoxynucleotidase YfbR-like HD superfamily hydrolase